MSSFNGGSGLAFPAGFAAAGYPAGAIPTWNTQSAANGSCIANLNSAAGKTVYMVGFMVTGLGATAATSVVGTVAQLFGPGTLSFDIGVPAGVTTQITPLIFIPGVPWPAQATNTLIQITVPAFGAGNTQVHCSIWGFQL